MKELLNVAMANRRQRTMPRMGSIFIRFPSRSVKNRLKFLNLQVGKSPTRLAFAL